MNFSEKFDAKMAEVEDLILEEINNGTEYKTTDYGWIIDGKWFCDSIAYHFQNPELVKFVKELDVERLQNRRKELLEKIADLDTKIAEAKGGAA